MMALSPNLAAGLTLVILFNLGKRVFETLT